MTEHMVLPFEEKVLLFRAGVWNNFLVNFIQKRGSCFIQTSFGCSPTNGDHDQNLIRHCLNTLHECVFFGKKYCSMYLIPYFSLNSMTKLQEFPAFANYSFLPEE